MKSWLKVFIIYFIFGLLVYCNSLNNKFLIDDYAFKSNPVMSERKYILSQWNPYREPQLGDYRPLAYSLNDFSYDTFKNNFWQYHLFNLFLFVFTSSLIYLFIEKVTRNYNLALLAGLFYLIHPINGIIVNYISASAFAFQMFCMLTTVILLLESLERKNNRILYFFSLLFSFLSLFWHENGIMTPLYVAAVILLFGKDSNKAKIIYLFPYFLICFFYILFRINFAVSTNILKQTALFHVTGWQYLAVIFKVYAWYISKLFYPQGIVMQWGTSISQDHIVLNVLGLGALLMVSLLLFVNFAKTKILQMAIVWVLIGFVPVLLGAMIRSYTCAVIEPHWFVFSSIGFFILAAQSALFVLERAKKTGAVLLFILILSWGSISYAYNQLWSDQKKYALYWSQQAPDFKPAYIYLAYAYKNEGDLRNSKKYYRMALSGYPADGNIYFNVGAIDQVEGHFKDAELNYKMALKINPFSANAYANLGSIYYEEGRFDKAKENFSLALILNPLLEGSITAIRNINDKVDSKILMKLKDKKIPMNVKDVGHGD